MKVGGWLKRGELNAFRGPSGMEEILQAFDRAGTC